MRLSERDERAEEITYLSTQMYSTDERGQCDTQRNRFFFVNMVGDPRSVSVCGHRDVNNDGIDRR